MATFEESFVYPLILLLIGAGVSGVLVAWLTNRWQDRRKERETEVEDHRKKLEIKIDITSKMSEVMASEEANSIASISRKKKTFTDDDKVAYFESMRKSLIEHNIIRSKLQTYFSETNIEKRWEDYYDTLRSFGEVSRHYFYEAPSEEQKKSFKYFLEFIGAYFSDNTRVDWNRFKTEMTYDLDMWNDVLILLMNRGNELIKDVLKHPIKVF